MDNKEISVSYVITVYNKEPYIAATARSILGQEGPQRCEYIFVDDCSTDRSVAVIEDLTRGLSNVTIVKNTVNAGPSVRLNQGARLARGKYLQFFDSDDIMAANATVTLHRLMEEHRGDLVYGKWARTDVEGSALLDRRIPDNAAFRVSDKPMEAVLGGHYVRMALMVRREVFLAAGGCDENIFIQDESLPLRLAAHAKRFLALDAPVMFVPKVEGVLSGNKTQLNHDRFLANRNMLLAGNITLSEDAQRLLFRRCVSAAWKQKRAAKPLAAHVNPIFLRYISSKLRLQPVNLSLLEELSKFFASQEGVRRIAARG